MANAQTAPASPESTNNNIVVSTDQQGKRSYGGRHRIFTAEQRKIRNKLAQAAFRERRSQYTQTLEETLDNFETIFSELQESNRNLSLRANKAEKQCEQLKGEAETLKQMLQLITAENQCLRDQWTAHTVTTVLPRSPLYDLNSQISSESPKPFTMDPLIFKQTQHVDFTAPDAVATTAAAALLCNENSFFPSLDFAYQEPSMFIQREILASPSSPPPPPTCVHSSDQSLD